MALANLSFHCICKNIRSEFNNNQFKISAPIWIDTFDLQDGSFSFSYIQDYFEFIIKKHETLTGNPLVQIYVNRIKNKIVFKKTGYKIELLTLKQWNCKEAQKKDVDKDKDGENLPKLESVEFVLVHCNLVENDYQDTSKVLFACVPNKQFGQLINISAHSFFNNDEHS